MRTIVLLAVLLFGTVQQGNAQRVYATAVSTGGTGSNGSVTNPNNAISPPPGTTEPTATPRAGVSATGNSTRYISLEFGSTIPANTAVWISVSNRNIGTSASITATAYNGTTPASGSSSEYISLADGSAYYRVTANSSFDRVRITASGGVVILVQTTASLNVHFAFYESASTDCSAILGTSTNTTLGASINNPAWAIDGNISTYATFVPVILVGGVMTQTVYLSALSNPYDAATITFSLPPSLLNLSLFNSITIRTYNGSTLVSEIPMSSLLSLDILGLLSSGEIFTVSHTPDNAFDRIAVEYNAGLLLSSNLNLWEVNRSPAKPIVPIAYPDVIEVCEDESAIILAESPSIGSIIRWYDDVNDGILLQEGTTNTDAYTTPPLSYTSPTDTTFLYVAAAWDSDCASESERTKIAIIVLPKSVVLPITGEDEVCQNGSIILTSATGGGVWSSADEAIATVNPSSGEVTGISMGTVTIRYAVTDNQTSCTNMQEKEITVNALPTITLSTIPPVCEGDVEALLPYSATANGADRYSIAWDGSPAGFLDVTDAALPATPITIVIPASASIGVYTGILTVSNSTTGCESQEYPFTLTLNPTAGKPHITITDIQN